MFQMISLVVGCGLFFYSYFLMKKENADQGSLKINGISALIGFIAAFLSGANIIIEYLEEKADWFYLHPYAVILIELAVIFLIVPLAAKKLLSPGFKSQE